MEAGSKVGVRDGEGVVVNDGLGVVVEVLLVTRLMAGEGIVFGFDVVGKFEQRDRSNRLKIRQVLI
jgi:hypothetical protein